MKLARNIIGAIVVVGFFINCGNIKEEDFYIAGTFDCANTGNCPRGPITWRSLPGAVTIANYLKDSPIISNVKK